MIENQSFQDKQKLIGFRKTKSGPVAIVEVQVVTGFDVTESGVDVTHKPMLIDWPLDSSESDREPKPESESA